MFPAIRGLYFKLAEPVSKNPWNTSTRNQLRVVTDSNNNNIAD